jgi:hypothetical protein
MIRPTLLIAACSIVAISLTGCETISGHKLTIDKNGVVTTTDVHGLPIVVKRPTKAVYIVTATTYSVSQQTIDANGVVGASVALPDQTEVTISDQPALLGPTEIFTIDPKRPAFGTLDYGINMTDGVVTSLTGKLDDKTLGEIHQIVKDVLDKVIPTPSAPTDNTPDKQSGTLINRTLAKRSVSLAIFDLETGTVKVEKMHD